ncbi:MAG TPA: site-specific integrase [Pseudonocardiaceae bacterium]
MAGSRRRQKDLTGIRQRGSTYQVRVFSGVDPVTGKKAYLSASAPTEDEAIKLRDRLQRDITDNKAARTSVTVAYLLDEWLSAHRVELKTRQSYELLITKFIKPTLGDVPLPKLARLGPQVFERLYADLSRCRRRCGGREFIEHHARCPQSAGTGDACNAGCKPHSCRPLAPSSVRQVHAVLSGALSAAVRWGWMGVNPADAAVKPRASTPQPKPPTSEQAAEIVKAAWSKDEEWGTFVWLTFVTGARRGELVGLRWKDFNTVTRVLTIERSVVRGDGELVVKDTKTHQMRRISLDEATAEILAEHKKRYHDLCAEAAIAPSGDAYIFSHEPDHSRPCDPDAISHRYTRMAAKLGIKTHLHQLRHYSATELLAAGVDLRTVAGRLGHGGGGATTLKVYAAWHAGADKQAAALLASRLPARPTPTTAPI